MPRVHFVRKARKDNPAVKAGESYYWWKFRHGGKNYSANRPRQSQLCQGKNSSYYAALETAEDALNEADSMADLTEIKETLMSELECVQDEYQSGLDNMPDQLQWGSTGEGIQEAIDAIQSLRDEIECVDIDEAFDDVDEYDEEEPSEDDFDDPEDFEHAHNQWQFNKDDHIEEQEGNRQNAFDTAKDDLTMAMESSDFPY